MSIYNQEQLTLEAQPDTTYYFRRTPKGEEPIINSISADGDIPLFTSQSLTPIQTCRIILFLRDDECSGSLKFYVYDEDGVLSGTSSSTTLSGTPLHTIDYTLETPLPPNTPINFALKTSSDFSTKTLVFQWINMVLY